jgi:hypothetical protein
MFPVIYLGIDDTDVEGSRGTNQLARSLVAALASEYRCLWIVRHQLLVDPRVPCTTKNGSASIALEPLGPANLSRLAEVCRGHMLSDFIDGSDPGLCVTSSVPPAVTEFGIRCQSELVCQAEAHEVAGRHGLFLEGLGGTNGGIIGALAAVGLAVTGNDGRVIQLAQWPDDVSGVQSIRRLGQRDVTVCGYANGEKINDGLVDVGKRLRPNRRRGENVLFVETVTPGDDQPLKAMKLP